MPHVVANVKRKKARIFRIQNEHGKWITDSTEIASTGVESLGA